MTQIDPFRDADCRNKAGKSWRCIFLLWALFVLLLPLCALASEPSSDLMEMSLQDLMRVNVYTASRFNQQASDAPASVTIITGSEIQKYGYRTLADILRSVRSLYVTNDRNYSNLGIRGFSSLGGYNHNFLLLVNGVRINDGIFDAAMIGQEFPVDVDLIERVEIIRGPGSSLYGANALLGVINVITRKGREVGHPEFSGAIGTLETYKGRISYGNAFPSGLETTLSGTYYSSEGNERLYFQKYDHPETNEGIAEDCDRERAYQLLGTLSFQDFTLEAVYSNRKKVVPTAEYGTVFNTDRTFTLDAQGFVDLKYEHTFARDWEVLARIHYGYYGYKGDYLYDYAEGGQEPDLVMNRDDSRSEWWGAEAQVSKTLFQKHHLILGAEYRDNFRQDQLNYDSTGAVYLKSREDSFLWGLYLQDEFRILSNLILNAGLRYDHYSTFGGTTNPRLGLIWSPFEKTTFKALYGKAFRPPNAYELYYNDSYFTMKENPDLKPESTQTLDLILEQGWGNHLRGTINGYYYEIKDLINEVLDPADGLLVSENTGDVIGKGIELELEGKWDNGLSGRISYAYQESEEEDTGQDLVNSPRHLANLNVTLPLLKEKVLLGLEEQYVGPRKTVYGHQVDGYFVTNLTLFSQNLLKGLQVSVSVYNLFNNNYRDPVGPEIGLGAVRQDGRTFRLKVTYAF